MSHLIECVPNFSEGRRREVVDALAAALTLQPGAVLLDREMDAAHNRCVLTVAGEPEAVARGVIEAVGKAVIRATKKVGRPPEDRPFSGHLTLARARDRRRGVDLQPLCGVAVAAS